MRYPYLLFLGLGLALPWAARAQEPTTPNGFDARPQVVLIGDSLTEGVIEDPAMPSGLEPDQRLCFADLCFAAQIEARLAACGVATARHGYGGATSRDWDPNDFREDDAHFNITGRELFSYVPAANVAVVFLGINDAVGFFEGNVPVPVGEYAEHLVDIAWTLRARGVQQVLLVTAPTPTAWRAPHEAGPRLEAYAFAARGIAAELDFVGLVDVARGYPVDEWHGAAIHPTFAGHQWIAQALLAELARIDTGSCPTGS